MEDSSRKILDDEDPRRQKSNQLLYFYEHNQIEELKEYIGVAKAAQSFDAKDLIDLAKLSKESANLVKELVNLKYLDETELVEKIAKEIMSDMEKYISSHLHKYQKYTLDAPQLNSRNYLNSREKFFNLISLLKDVSVLGRKLLEASPRFESFKHTASPPITAINPTERKLLITNNRSSKDSRSHMSEEDATSEDLLAALVESSSSDDFLVLSSSLDSITVHDMMFTSLILITSHECFTLSHDIQGVVMVLRRTKFMIKNILAPKNQMELVVKLLTSICRYNEMNYVFDLFRDRNEFELLLSKGVEKTPELRIALFNYVKKNPEFYDLVTLKFSMYREIAESLEASANRRLDKLIQGHRNKRTKKKVNVMIPIAINCVDADGTKMIEQKRYCAIKTDVSDDFSDDRGSSLTGSMKKSNSIATGLSNSAEQQSSPECNTHKPIFSYDSLNMCLIEMVDAADCYAKADCYKRSNSCENKARLIALQMALLPSDTNVLDLQQSELNDMIISFESFMDAHIVSEAYNYHLAWRQALFRNVVLRAQSNYLDEFCAKCDLCAPLVMELVHLYKQYISSQNNQLSHNDSQRLADSMTDILARLDDVEVRCKLYIQLNLVEAKEQLLQNPSIQAHLKDLKLA